MLDWVCLLGSVNGIQGGPSLGLATSCLNQSSCAQQLNPNSYRRRENQPRTIPEPQSQGSGTWSPMYPRVIKTGEKEAWPGMGQMWSSNWLLSIFLLGPAHIFTHPPASPGICPSCLPHITHPPIFLCPHTYAHSPASHTAAHPAALHVGPSSCSLHTHSSFLIPM